MLVSASFYMRPRMYEEFKQPVSHLSWFKTQQKGLGYEAWLYAMVRVCTCEAFFNDLSHMYDNMALQNFKNTILFEILFLRTGISLQNNFNCFCFRYYFCVTLGQVMYKAGMASCKPKRWCSHLFHIPNRMKHLLRLNCNQNTIKFVVKIVGKRKNDVFWTNFTFYKFHL
jgi:hypothetical protein